MNMHLVPVGEDSQSPFDTIKNINPETEAEYWSARNLMPLLGYDRWENFSQAIDRAKIAAEVQGQDVEKLFRGITKRVQDAHSRTMSLHASPATSWP